MKRGSASRGSLVVGVVAVIVLGVSGCRPEIDVSGPYADELRTAASQASSDFERAVFEDGEITRDEYEEAMRRYLDCVTSAGATVGLIEQSGYYTYEIRGDIALYDSVADECGMGTKSLIEPLYVDMLQNPEKLDPAQNLANCLVRQEVVPESFTGEDLRELLDRGGYGDVEGTPWEGYDLTPENPAFARCLENPAAG